MPRIVLLLIPIILVELALLAVALVDWARRGSYRYLNKWVWLAIIVAVSGTGSIAYLVLGRGDDGD